jgi:UDP-GlcNAc:undecaprenyl-phosphate/decaprenyl-phosphate GlcNAc-1-phosphate transferase
MGSTAGILGAVVAGSLLMSYGLAMAARRLGLVDAGNHRTVHGTPTPRIGGVAVMLAFIAGCVAVGATGPPGSPSPWMLALVAGSFVIGAVGLIDDLRGLPPAPRILVQVIVALMFVVVSGGVRLPHLPGPGAGRLMAAGLGVGAVCWIVGVTNAVNLIDGLDGLAIGTVMPILGGIALVAWRAGRPVEAIVATVLVCSLLGFAPSNFPRARIFLGDGGAYMLGFVVAALALRVCLQQDGSVALAAFPLAAVSLPIFDTLAAFARRAGRWTQADREHIHHRVLARGWGAQKAVVVLVGMSALAAGVACMAVWCELGAVAVAWVCVCYAMWVILYVRAC